MRPSLPPGGQWICRSPRRLSRTLESRPGPRLSQICVCSELPESRVCAPVRSRYRDPGHFARHRPGGPALGLLCGRALSHVTCRLRPRRESRSLPKSKSSCNLNLRPSKASDSDGSLGSWPYHPSESWRWAEPGRGSNSCRAETRDSDAAAAATALTVTSRCHSTHGHRRDHQV